MEDLLQILGKRIRAYRKSHGLTQDEVAEQAGVSQSYIGAVERGEQNLTIVSLEKILHTLGMRFDEIFTHEDNNEHSRYIMKEIVVKLQTRPLTDQMFILRIVNDFIDWKDG